MSSFESRQNAAQFLQRRSRNYRNAALAMSGIVTISTIETVSNMQSTEVKELLVAAVSGVIASCGTIALAGCLQSSIESARWAKEMSAENS